MANTPEPDAETRVIFGYTNPEDLEPRLRMIIAFARQEVKEPKDRYVQFIMRAFKEAGYLPKAKVEAAIGQDEEIKSHLGNAGGVRNIFRADIREKLGLKKG